MRGNKKINIDENYWYQEDDIQDLLRILVDGRANIFAQTQIEHQDLLADNFRIAVQNSLNYGVVNLIPIHVRGNHWTSALVRRRDDGVIQVIYNDPMGNDIYSNKNGALLLTQIRNIAGGFDFIDVRLQQQFNGNDCGPFATDNLVRLLDFALDPSNNLDHIDRSSLISGSVLRSPADGNAREIRRDHAVILPRLRHNRLVNLSDMDYESKRDQLKQNAQTKSNKAMLEDVKTFLKIKSLIQEIKSIATNNDSDKEKKLTLLKELGRLAGSIYRKESDEQCFRNKYGKIIGLDSLEQLKFIDLTKRSEFNKFDLFSLDEDLDSVSDAIDYALDQEISRVEDIAKEYGELTKNFLAGLPSKGSVSKTTPRQFNKDGHLNLLAAIYYLPKAIQRIIDILNDYGFDFDKDTDFSKMENRYAFSRVLAMIGELSRSIRYVIPDQDLQEFFKRLNKARDGVKTSHFKVIVSGFANGDYSSFNNLADTLNQVKNNLSDFLDELAMINGGANYLADLGSLLSRSINEVKEVKIFEDSLKVKGVDLSKLTTSLNKVTSLLKESDDSMSESDYDIQDYQDLYSKLNASDKDKYKFPASGTLIDLKKFQKPIIQGKPSQEVMDMMKFIKKMSKYKTTQEQLKLAMDITAAIANYRTELRKIPEDERYDKLRSPFPEARENDIRQYQLPSPRNKLAKNDPTPRNKPAKNDPEKFSKYCRDFDEELKRLQEIIASNSSNQELEIAHSVGIMGEAIRFMFEIDDQDYSLSDFFSQELLDDINHVRFVRNSQVMHGVFNYDANVVFRASDQNALSWKNDVEALSRIHQFIKIIKDKDPNALLAEAKLTNPDVTIAQVQARPISYLAGYYSRLEKYEDVEELIKEFDDFYAKISDDQKLEILQEKILIETLRSKIQYKNGDIPGATSTLEKALDIQGFQDDSVLADSLRIEKARIYNNLGYFCEENGDFKKAKDFFSRSSKLSRGHVLNLYSSCQYASILFYEEGKYREAIKIMGTAIRSEYARSGKIDSGNIYELMMAYRQIMLIQSEVGDSEKAEKTFKIYQELCSRTKLLKLSLGRNYKIVESIFMQDMAGESYNKGDYREAINNWQNAISLLNDVGVNSKTQSIGHCFLGIANSYKYLASSAKDGQERNRYRLLALEYYDNAQELAVQCNEQNSLFMAHCLSGSGQILQSLGRHDISRSVLKKAQEINKGHGNRGQYYQEKSNVSLRALDMNKYRGGRGVKYSKVAMQQDEELDNFQALAVNCMKANQFKDALFYLESDKAQIESEGSYSPVYATTLKNIIVCCCRLGKPGKAAQNCKILDDFLTKHPDCDNGKYREEVNSNMQSLGSSYKWSNKEQVISSNVRPSSVVAIIDFSKVIGNIKDRM